MKTYKIKATLTVTYELREENENDALGVAKDLLYQKIDKRNVAYDELESFMIDEESKSDVILNDMFRGTNDIYHADGKPCVDPKCQTGHFPF